MVAMEDLLICNTCGTQYNIPATEPPSTCRICDDPRQYVLPTGYAWTSLRELQRDRKCKNVRTLVDKDERITQLVVEPKVGIGQRCFFLQTPAGNVLWDCVAFLDDETTEFIESKGGLKAIVISHPHFYTTHIHWAQTFGCPVYVSFEDREWLNMSDPNGLRRLIKGTEEEIVPGVKAVKLGGHFPGSLVLLWERKLFIADTLMTVPSALYHVNRPSGTSSYAFMWSIPNMIPLPPSEMERMWRLLEPLEFDTTYGVMTGQNVYDEQLKGRVLESMKIQIRAEGHHDVALLKEQWP